MNLYFVRHGESAANKKFLHAGWAPVHLTDKGINDAKKAGQILADINFDVVISSDLVRVMETCFYATGKDNPKVFEELRELNVGSLAGQSPKELAEKFGNEYRSRFSLRDYRAYGGECMEDLLARVSTFMRMMEEKPYSTMSNILVFSSEGPIDMALSYAIGFKDAYLFKKVSCDNGSICILGYQEGGPWYLKKWNYTGKMD